ncbi:hypothetical protein T03_8468 [Trichinella britovi]|uniref:Uncharacterized protein n=1 Tax=Trichinella britovi TaxID=45882 RepID=A0A0V1CQX8_TRIBR|nr:hypothetical protein T03_8468 [Trichinella britovi]
MRRYLSYLPCKFCDTLTISRQLFTVNFKLAYAMPTFSQPGLATKLSIPSLGLKARAFSCKMGPLIGRSSARFWRNHITAIRSIHVEHESQLADVDCNRCLKLWIDPHQDSQRFS